jgi:hypothetical protein
VPDIAVSAELLDDLLEGRTSTFGQESPEATLVALAARCRELTVGGPTPDVSLRLRGRFDALITGGARRWWQGWVGPAPRPLVQRMAAGFVLLAASGGGASAATGVTPREFVTDAAGFVNSVAQNLGPRGDSSEPVPSPSPSASPSPQPSAIGTQTPPATTTPTQGGVPTATDGVDDDDNDRTRTPEPGDDNGGDRGGDNSGSGSQNSGPGSSGGDD